MPWRGPSYPGELPTLGYGVIDWMLEYLVVPDGPSAGEPLSLTDEQAQFILDFYKVDPTFEGPAIVGRTLRNARIYHRGILSRSKGWGKSPILAGMGHCEACGDVICDGWDADGEPVARPWSSLGFRIRVQVLAVSEDQTQNTWDPMLQMITPAYMSDYGVEPLDTRINVPNGKIEYATSAGDSKEGGRPIFSILDQTESWKPSNGGVKLAAAVRRNLTKTQGTSIESPNAFRPGDNSVAESSFKAVELQRANRNRGLHTILLDHREAPPDTDPTDEQSLRKGLAIAYGESADVNGGWVNLDRVAEDYWDPDADPMDSRLFFLNQISHKVDAWLTHLELESVKDSEKVVKPGEAITLGFDGSRGRKRGFTDATALIACRVSDGHLFEPPPTAVWEQPSSWPRNQTWKPPVPEILAAVAHCFRSWNVVGFYADPEKWESYIAAWEAKYGKRLRVKSSREHPIEWWMKGGRASKTVQALESFKNAVLDEELTFDGGAFLTQHLLNARMRDSRSGVQIAKESPESRNKIDAAVAAVLAWQARLDAIAAGVTGTIRPPSRIR